MEKIMKLPVWGLSLVISGHVLADRPPIYKIGDVVDSIVRQTHGLIMPAALPEALQNHRGEMIGATQDLRFSLDEANRAWSELPLAPALLQDMFILAEDKLIKATFSHDLLQAKIAWNRQFPWQESSRSYVPAFMRPSDWNQLPHPPVTQLSQTASYYNKRIKYPYQSSAFNSTFSQQIDQSTQTELSHGNQVSLLEDQALYNQKLQFITQAQKSINGVVTILSCDETTKDFIDALIASAGRRIKTRLLVEQILERRQNYNCQRELKAAGVEVKMARAKTQLHSKYWVIDDQTAIIDDQDIADIAVGSDGFNHLHHNQGAKVTGPVLVDLREDFAVLWESVGKSLSTRLSQQIAQIRQQFNLEKIELAQRGLRSGVHTGGNSCRFISQGPHTKPDLLSAALLSYLKAAQSYIFVPVQSFDFDSDHAGVQSLLQLLEDKARQGVAIDLLANAHILPTDALEIDNAAIDQQSGRLLVRAIEAIHGKKLSRNLDSIRTWALPRFRSLNLRTWSFFQFNNSKLSVLDNEIVYVGSHRLSEKSFSGDYEAGLICQDKELAVQAARLFTRDLINSTPFSH